MSLAVKNNSQETPTSVFCLPQKEEANRGQEVNLALVLNNPTVTVGCSELAKDSPASGWECEPQKGQQTGDSETVRGSVYQPCFLHTEAALRLTDISQNSWLCYYCVLLCALRWIGSAFRLTKSLGMHTGVGSGDSNAALSWAIKEDNTSCPPWTGLVNTRIPILWGETLPSSHLTKMFSIFFSLSKAVHSDLSACVF